MAVEINMFGPS
ncbi:hypothetical protein RDI58_013672 [Solanum bulbocastanum]|uniref:Uncharacterized protein n=1 Tax=Solanum bulbocastanum TaxID=147425 RepID=A0AAN8TR65_SOLBU